MDTFSCSCCLLDGCDLHLGDGPFRDHPHRRRRGLPSRSVLLVRLECSGCGLVLRVPDLHALVGGLLGLDLLAGGEVPPDVPDHGQVVDLLSRLLLRGGRRDVLAVVCHPLCEEAS